jgi:hypothetical protein
MLSKFDLLSTEKIGEEQLKEIDKEQLDNSDEILEKYSYDLYRKSFDSVDFNLSIQADESFAIIKYIFNEQLITNRENDFDDLNQLQEDLIFGAENTSFLSFFSNYLKSIIDLYIGYFKNELFNVGDEFGYFDKIVTELINDFIHLEKLLYADDSYFLPIIREFRLQYSNLLKWIFTDFSFYLTKENKSEIEKLIFPRENIKTFTIIEKSFNINHYANIVGQLKEDGFVAENTKGKDLKDVFSGTRNVNGIINWTKGIGTLNKFIELLKQERVIEEANVWEISSRYFYVRGKKISTKQLRDATPSKDNNTIGKLKKIVLRLK